MTTPSLPNPKAPPKASQERAKAQRAKLKACHGNWWSHEVAQAHGLVCVRT